MDFPYEESIDRTVFKTYLFEKCYLFCGINEVITYKNVKYKLNNIIQYLSNFVYITRSLI